MADLKKVIPTTVITALVALGGGAATIEITASRGVDAIIANEVVSAEKVASTMTVLRWENGDELERLKKHLLPLATEIKNNGYIEVLKLDELQALYAFGAKAEIKMENGENANEAIYRYLETQLEPNN